MPKRRTPLTETQALDAGSSPDPRLTMSSRRAPPREKQVLDAGKARGGVRNMCHLYKLLQPPALVHDIQHDDKWVYYGLPPSESSLSALLEFLIFDATELDERRRKFIAALCVPLRLARMGGTVVYRQGDAFGEGGAASQPPIIFAMRVPETRAAKNMLAVTGCDTELRESAAVPGLDELPPDFRLLVYLLGHPAFPGRFRDRVKTMKFTGGGAPPTPYYYVYVTDPGASLYDQRGFSRLFANFDIAQMCNKTDKHAEDNAWRRKLQAEDYELPSYCGLFAMAKELDGAWRARPAAGAVAAVTVATEDPVVAADGEPGRPVPLASHVIAVDDEADDPAPPAPPDEEEIALARRLGADFPEDEKIPDEDYAGYMQALF